MVAVLWSHELQHVRFPVLHYLPEFAQTHVCWVSNAIQPSHPLSSPSPPAVPFSSCRQSFPASESFPMSWLFTLRDQSIGASASELVLPVIIQGWFPLGLTGLISLLSNGLARVFSNTQLESISSLPLSLLCGPTVTSIQDYWKKT